MNIDEKINLNNKKNIIFVIIAVILLLVVIFLSIKLVKDHNNDNINNYQEVKSEDEY